MEAFEEFRRPQMALGMTVREIRHARDLTQEDLSGVSGLHATYISDVERGLRNIGWMALASLVKGLNVSHEEFGARYEQLFAEHWAKLEEDADAPKSPA